MNSLRRPTLACLLACLLSGCFGGAAKPRPEVRVRAETLIQRAVRAEHKGDLPEAENLLTESLRLSTSIEDNPAMAAARINLARLYRLRHDTARAREAIDGALALLGTEADSYGEAAQEKALIELTTDSGVALAWAHKAVTAERGSWGGRRLNLLGRIQVGRGDLTT
ncbi:MAG TPA: tetratricopeptide repeat protein, partial [Desulfuromonadaceae bacterium]